MVWANPLRDNTMHITGDTAYKQANFDLVGEIVAVGYYDPANVINGYMTPCFDIETCEKIIKLVEPIYNLDVQFERTEDNTGYIITDETDGLSDTWTELDREIEVNNKVITVNPLVERWVWDAIGEHCTDEYNVMIVKGVIQSTVEQLQAV